MKESNKHESIETSGELVNRSWAKNIPWYLPLAAAYPALNLYASNVKETQFLSVIIAIAAISLITFLGWVLVGAIVKDIRRSALPVSVAVLFFFLYNYGRTIFSMGHTVYLPLHSVITLVAIGAAWFVDCRRAQVSRIANIAMICLVLGAVLLAAGGVIRLKLGQKPTSTEGERAVGEKGLFPNEVKKMPDVFCIILDSYASKVALNKWFGFDNSEFINALSSRGFNIPTVSASNFTATRNALPTLLGMGYSDKDSKVPRYLQEKGYKFWYSRSVYALSKSAELADRILGKDYGTEFWHQLFLQSMLGPSWKTFGGSYRKAVLNNFRHLEEALEDFTPRPLFMFTHIMVPHSPFVFKANGRARYLLYTGRRKDIPKLKSAYVDQCIFANHKILPIIDAIVSSERGRKAVIILMGDHGPFYQLFSPEPEDGIDASWEMVMYQNLLAIRLPNGEQQTLPALTSVNVFPWIFHIVFKDPYLPVPNKFFRDYVSKEKDVDATGTLSQQLGFSPDK